MKQQAIQYLALDVHQASCVVTIRDETGVIVMRATVPTGSRAILQLIKSARPRVHVGFEEGTQAQWLHDLLVPHAEKVIVRSLSGSGSERRTGQGHAGADIVSIALRLWKKGELWNPKKLTMQAT